ncbi:MAG: thioredoxin-dependent thiol peroxidase [Alphaproteobacteria bacterium]|nr:thioredoxin-dependent thiol peroxidase [Alphaproteobacteria bacterium]
MLAVGDRPADFTLPDQDGTPVSWSSFRGKPVAVFFYPKALTPGCTTEACDFRDARAELEALGVAVIGMSADPVKKQKSFADKHALPYPLLSDTEHAVLAPWGVWGPKKLYGRTFDGITRASFLFDADGVVVAAWPKVKVAGHVDAVAAAARDLVNG